MEGGVKGSEGKEKGREKEKQQKAAIPAHWGGWRALILTTAWHLAACLTRAGCSVT